MEAEKQKQEQFLTLAETLINYSVDYAYEQNKTRKNNMAISIAEKVNHALKLLEKEIKPPIKQRPIKQRPINQRRKWTNHWQKKEGGGNFKEALLSILKKKGPENLQIRLKEFVKIVDTSIPDDFKGDIVRAAALTLVGACFVTGFVVSAIFTCGVIGPFLFGLLCVFGGIFGFAGFVNMISGIVLLGCNIKKAKLTKKQKEKQKQLIFNLCKQTGNIMKTLEQLSTHGLETSSHVYSIVLRVIYDMEVDLIPASNDTVLHPFLNLVAKCLYNEQEQEQTNMIHLSFMIFERLIYFPHNQSYNDLIESNKESTITMEVNDLLRIYIQASSYQYALCGVRAPSPSPLSITEVIKDLQTGVDYPFDIGKIVETNTKTLDELWMYKDRSNVCEGLEYWKKNKFHTILDEIRKRRQIDTSKTDNYMDDKGLKLIEDPLGLISLGQVKGGRKKLSAYNIFMSKHLRAGKKMKEIAALWNKTKHVN